MKSKRAQLMAQFVFALLGMSAIASAKPWWMRGIDAKDTDFLPPDAAFKVSAAVDGNLIKVRWLIADGYYLYRQKVEIRAESPGLVVSAPALPGGVLKTDPYLGTQEIYLQQLDATVAYTRSDAGAHPLQVKVTYQGCAEAGLCYLPMTKVLFPTGHIESAATTVHAAPWQKIAILGGGLAFLCAGFVLRKGRTLATPPV